MSLKHYSPGWYLFPHVWLLSQHFHDFSTQGIDAITFGTDTVTFLPLGKKNTLSPVTVCIGAHYITKGCYDFRFLKELCNNQLQAGMRLYIAAIFRFH